MAQTDTVLEKLKDLITPLEPEEQMRIVQALEEMLLDAPEGRNKVVEQAQEPDKLTEEQEAWFAQPREVRQQYRGEFVAVHNRAVVDHDPDKRALYIRVRQRFGRTPVLIISADRDEPPVYQIHSPRLER